MRQSIIGAVLTLAIVGAWLTLHIYCVFFYNLSGAAVAFSPLLVAMICWLNVGLFIIAHDAMHGTLFPKLVGLNRAAGRIALALYAGFQFDRLKRSHMEHHRFPGSRDDPDFDADHPNGFWSWYRAFMHRYFGVREFLVLCVPVTVYLLIGARIANLLLFWALPAALSSLQLFYFGTFLPHRRSERAFADQHNARSNEFGWFLSLITCFHFGYHHEHHLTPSVPWWALPNARRARRIAREGLPPA